MYKSVLYMANILKGLGLLIMGLGVLFIPLSLATVSAANDAYGTSVGVSLVAVLLQSIMIILSGLFTYGSGAILAMFRDGVEYLRYIAKSQIPKKVR